MPTVAKSSQSTKKLEDCRRAKRVAWSNWKANQAYAKVLKANIARLIPLIPEAESLVSELKAELAYNERALRIAEAP